MPPRPACGTTSGQCPLPHRGPPGDVMLRLSRGFPPRQTSWTKPKVVRMVTVMAVRPEPYRFTVDEYHRMAEVGLLGEDERVELIGGEIVAMAPIGSRHAACVARLTRLLSRAVSDAIVWVQNPVRLDDNTEVQPDVALLGPKHDFYVSEHPTTADVLLIIEVAETTVTYDRSVKLSLYAAAGVPEVWLIDLGADVVETYRSPTGESYSDVETIQAEGQLTSLAFPAASFGLESLLGT